LGIAGSAVFVLVLTAFFFLWRFTVQKRQLAETRIRQLEQEQQLIATQSVLDGETAERTRLARDLHDGLGGKLTGVKLHLQELKRSAKLDDADVQQYDKAMDMLDASVVEMRRVSHNLMPDALSRFGLKPAVDDFCRSMSSGIVFNFYGNETRLDPKLELLIYRCIHELVNNALKYSGASQIMVQIMQEADSIDFTVQDDGCGFDPLAATKGTGLQNIRTRIASFGGNIHIDTNAGEGTEINVELKIMN
jgi:signal transduction histidine kinase